MKILILVMFILTSLFSNEMQRIENIVKDISKLRVDYEECQNQLALKNNNVSSFKASECDCSDVRKDIEFALLDEKQKNKILLKELNDFKLSNKDSEIEKLKQKIEELEKTVKIQYEVLKTKDSLINDYELEVIELKKKNVRDKQEDNISVKTDIVCEKPQDTNVFPKLVMKDNLTAQNLKEKPQEFQEIKQDIQEVEAAAYKLNQDAKIYDAIDGNEIDSWTIDTSFTSFIRSQNWIKITGYFIDKKWLPSATPMWIRAEMASKKKLEE